MTYAFIIALQQKALFINDGPGGFSESGVDIGSPVVGRGPGRQPGV